MLEWRKTSRKGFIRLAFFVDPPTYNGFHVTPNYYSTTGVDGSLARSLGAQPQSQTLTFNQSAPFWNNLMSCQQNLFAGWNAFGGCTPPPQTPTCGTRPQPGQGGQCGGTQNIDIHVYHYRCPDGSVKTYCPSRCGGPFGSSGSGASQTSTSCNAFGSRSGCSSYQPSSNYNPFCIPNTWDSFGFGNNPACLPRPTGYIPSYQTCGVGGYQAGYQTPGNFGGYQAGYQTPGCFGGYVGQYPTSGYGGYQGSYQTGCFGGYQGSYQNGSFGGYQQAYSPLPQYAQQPSYSWGDFNAGFGSNSSSPFGVVPSAYAGYAMTSPFTDMGTAGGLALLGGALSMLF